MRMAGLNSVLNGERSVLRDDIYSNSMGNGMCCMVPNGLDVRTIPL